MGCCFFMWAVSRSRLGHESIKTCADSVSVRFRRPSETQPFPRLDSLRLAPHQPFEKPLAKRFGQAIALLVHSVWPYALLFWSLSAALAMLLCAYEADGPEASRFSKGPFHTKNSKHPGHSFSRVGSKQTREPNGFCEREKLVYLGSVWNFFRPHDCGFQTLLVAALHGMEARVILYSSYSNFSTCLGFNSSALGQVLPVVPKKLADAPVVAFAKFEELNWEERRHGPRGAMVPHHGFCGVCWMWWGSCGRVSEGAGQKDADGVVEFGTP